jgi:hypothetical protein
MEDHDSANVHHQVPYQSEPSIGYWGLACCITWARTGRSEQSALRDPAQVGLDGSVGLQGPWRGRRTFEAECANRRLVHRKRARNGACGIGCGRRVQRSLREHKSAFDSGYVVSEGENFSNLDMPAHSPYRCGWWYRKTFHVAANQRGKTILGINWVDWNPCPPDKDMALWGRFP